MGLLDKKERIIDLVLTDKGRELLSKGLLDFSYYAFGDEGIDYSGSLSAKSGITTDDYMFDIFSFEADQRKNSHGKYQNNDLKYFLFTIPSKQEVIPEFITSHDEISGSILMEKTFQTNDDLYTLYRATGEKSPKAIIAKVLLGDVTSEIRNSLYSLEQQVDETRKQYLLGKNISGMRVSKDFIAINKREAISMVDGSIQPVSFLLAQSDSLDSFREVISETKEKYDAILGTDSETIIPRMKFSEKEFSTSEGYMVEIYEITEFENSITNSGVDYKYTKIPNSAITDTLFENVIEDGIDSYLDLEIDVDD